MEQVADDRAEKARSRAMGAMGLTAVLAGVVLGATLTHFQGGFYIPLLMPYLLGRALGGLTVGVGIRWSPPLPQQASALGVIGALVTVCTYQVMAYDAVFDLLAAEMGDGLSAWLVELTGSSGLGAYLVLMTETTMDFASHASPFGVAGVLLTSPALFIAAFALDLLSAACGGWHGVVRSIASRPTPGGKEGTWHTAPMISNAHLGALMESIDASNFESVGQLLADADGSTELSVSLFFPEDDSRPNWIQIKDVRNGSLRASAELSSADMLLLVDHLRLAQAQRRYTTQATRASDEQADGAIPSSSERS